MDLMLREYEGKRDFTRTPEPPSPQKQGGGGPLVFVVQEHAARRLHYDFRLEVDGVLKSWSVPNGPSPDPKVKRLAVMVEDHPLDYSSFEGVIPKGEYGAGQVIVWDRGTYSPEEDGKLFFHDRAQAEERMRQDLAKGKVSVFLRGRKLRGSWTLVKMRQRKNDWLLIKHQDEFAEPDRDILKEDSSALSGISIEDLKAGHLPGHPGSVAVNPGDLPGAHSGPIPASVTPMLAATASAPFSDPDWLFEPKLDGFRTIALFREGNVRLLSRRGLDMTRQFPYVAEALDGQPVWESILDGEIVALDAEGRPCFQCLQQHLELMRGADVHRAEGQAPIIYYVFDILYLDGYDLRDVALGQRKALLHSVLRPSDRVRPVAYFERDGKAVHEASVSQGLEGVIAKRRDSLYEPGRRSRSWLKIKTIQSDEFVIGGYSQGLGNRAHTFGALLLGYFDDEGHLVYVGHVGTGFDDRTLADLRRRLDAIKADDCPFAEMPPLNAPTTWVRPELVVEVKFAQRTRDGYLRAPVFLRRRDEKSAAEVRRTDVVFTPVPSQASREDASTRLVGTVESVREQMQNRGESFTIEVHGHNITVSNADKELWPALGKRRALTKRDLIVYLARVSPYLLPHLRDRPLTLSRYPDGIHGEHFYQKHWNNPVPDFATTVRLSSEHGGDVREYLVCDNLATLLWLGQVADIEFHTWFSRTSPEPDARDLSESSGSTATADFLVGYPDFIVFDLDPYIYSGREARGAEPELNRSAFARTCEVALWLRDILHGLSLSSFVKTSGRTGLHVYVPILRQFDYRAVRSAAETIGRYLRQGHPGEITMDWPVEKRTGKVFLDYNQNMRGKTLASVYSARPAPEATVSVPLRWDELGEVYPTDFTILTTPGRLSQVGDLWAGILDARRDLKSLLEARNGQ
jgi:bifunctional non-homologous end joining protein LigD